MNEILYNVYQYFLAQMYKLKINSLIVINKKK